MDEKDRLTQLIDIARKVETYSNSTSQAKVTGRSFSANATRKLVSTTSETLPRPEKQNFSYGI